MARLTGKKLGQYKLGEVISWGNFGVVYKATRARYTGVYAIKVLKEDASDPNFSQRFRREAGIQSALRHPHIVPVDDYGVIGDLAYLVMPLIEGQSLATLLNNQGPQGLSLQDAFFYFKQMCLALDYAHAQGVVHLDLKPANMLVQPNGCLLLTDFGLAHFLAGDGGLSSSVRVGTPHYMAPERWDGKPDKASDIYALGVILYQMLAGRLPFIGQTAPDLMRQHLNEAVPPMGSIRAGLPLQLDQVLAEGLAKQPAQRYATAHAFQEAFMRAGSLQNVTVPPPDLHRPVPTSASAGGGFNAPTIPASLDARVEAAIGKLVVWLRAGFGSIPSALGRLHWRRLVLGKTVRIAGKVWGLPALLFWADVGLLPILLGLLFHSWSFLAASLVLPVLVLALCWIGEETGQRAVAGLGAMCCALLWGLSGWIVGLLARASVPVPYALGAGAFVILLYPHLRAFPARSPVVDAYTGHRYWRWWWLCVVNALGLPVLLGVTLHSSEVVAPAVFVALIACVPLVMVGDQRDLPILWVAGVLLLALFWGYSGWIIGGTFHSASFPVGRARVSFTAVVFAVLGTGLGLLAHFQLLFERRISVRQWKRHAWQWLFLSIDLLVLPAVAGLSLASWSAAGEMLGAVALLLLLVWLGYRQRKRFPLVFGVFLASLIWAVGGWAIGLVIGASQTLPLLHIRVAGTIVHGSWLSLVLAPMGLFVSSPAHFALFRPGSKVRHDSIDLRIWLLCALDLVGLPLALKLVLQTHLLFSLTTLALFFLLVLLAIANVSQLPLMNVIVIALLSCFWAFNGWIFGWRLGQWVGGMVGLPQVSFSVAALSIGGTWTALGVGAAVALLFLLCCWRLHYPQFGKRLP